MARTFAQMMQDVIDGISGRKKKELGPVGEAAIVLASAIRLAKEKNLYETSPVFRSSHVILDHVKQCRVALEAAAQVVNALEDPKFDTKNMHLVVAQFKAAAVKARLHQYVPLEKLPELSKLDVTRPS